MTGNEYWSDLNAPFLFQGKKFETKSFDEYQAMQEKIEVLEEIHKAMAQIGTGDGVSDKEAKAAILGRIKQ